jgi:acetylornithine deacetylase
METGRVIEILSSLVAFDTTSRNSNLPIIGWIEGLLAPLGFSCERIYDATGAKANLFATLGPAEVPGIILSGHTDVVPVDSQTWTSDPFALRVVDGRAYGRGTCDMKGYLAVCLAAAEQLDAGTLKKPVHLAFSYDEEVGCVGARGMVEWLRDSPLAPEACFVGEPTQMGVVVGHKSKRSVRVRVRGKTCHSSLAPLGVNAAEYAARLVAEIARLREWLATDGPQDPLYDVPYSTPHVGILRGGTALNIVPDEAEIVFEIRTIGADDPAALVDQVMAYARDELEPKMRAVDPAASIEFDVFGAVVGLDTAPGDPVVTLAKSLAGRNDHSKVAFGTEGGLFQTIAGVPTVVIGPGSIDQAHKADEWIAVSELEACGRFVDKLIATCR